ncbi:MAG: methyltransferase domain-containing protein [Steroidobacteraceae bacterium]
MTDIQAPGAHLDATQYQTAAITKYEAVYGRNFVSPGGADSARACITRLGLKPGMRVLDVGCGLGGSAFLMAREHGVSVHGIDVSANMVASARERLRAEALAAQVTLEQVDVTSLAATPCYHVIYSRDVFLHIHDKPRLMALLHGLLLPGGLLFFTDYARGEGPLSAEFAAYIAQREYDLRTVRDYRELLEQAGFLQVVAEDRTAEFVSILQAELARIADDAAHVDIRRSWLEKIERARRGEQGWTWCAGRVA